MIRRAAKTLVAPCLTAISLAAAVGVASVWPRTTRVLDQFLVRRGTVDFAVCTTPGRICFTREIDERPPARRRWRPPRGFSSTPYDVDLPNPSPPNMLSVTRVLPVDQSWHLLGFDVRDEAYAPNPRDADALLPRASNALPGVAWTGVDVPIWFIVVALLAWPTAWTIRLVRSRRRRVAGACAACGYDLRASPARCPECGETVATAGP